MTFGIDVATRTVVVTEPEDVFTIDSVVVGLGRDMQYSVLARSFATNIAQLQGISLEGVEGEWAFGSTKKKVSELLTARAAPGSLETVQVVTGHADTRPPGCCCAPPGWNDIWAAGPCPVHQGLRRTAHEAPNGSSS